jgi:hypothetical protein
MLPGTTDNHAAAPGPHRCGILDDVRHSEFWQLLDDEFGPAYARTVARDVVVDVLGGRTAEQALAAGALVLAVHRFRTAAPAVGGAA